MSKNCEKIKDQIADLVTSVLAESEKQKLEQHLNECPACRDYWQELQKEDKLLTEVFAKLNADMAARQAKVIETVNRCSVSKGGKIISAGRRILRSRITRFAAAAVLLIAVGCGIGQLSASGKVDMEELRGALEVSLKSSLEPAIRRDVAEELDQRWLLVLAGAYVQLRDELGGQFRRDLDTSAVQTLAASSAVTNQLLTELIEAINAAQMRDRRWVAAALEQIELNRVQDLAIFATATENELQRTRQDVAQWIAYSQPDSLVPEKNEN